eukprot:TRINITY_DN2843_c0_g2_i1.p2 TRINITY_DN2843_c0_g2~~TRINITY_DN2843_c0_g2_i1.p2  ORF type:complete len:138 (+),score=32.10 TRINITY_DN2843_c0_g2_i1:70-483(+)
MTTVDIPSELVDAFKKFKSSTKANRAWVMKINKEKLIVEVEDELDETSWEELVDGLPDSGPRFVAYSAEYVWDDGRKSYPLFFLYWCPYSVAVVDGTLYASTKTRLCTALSINKIFDARDKDELSYEWLSNKLKFFK